MHHDTQLPDESMNAIADRLNQKYGRPPKAEPVPRTPLTPKELADLQRYRAAQDAKAQGEQSVEERLQAWVLSAQSTAYRSKASQDAYAAAKKAKPTTCTHCQAEARLYGHHVTPYAQLKKEGRHLTPEAHVYVWLCLTCHAKQHPKHAAFIQASNDPWTR